MKKEEFYEFMKNPIELNVHIGMHLDFMWWYNKDYQYIIDECNAHGRPKTANAVAFIRDNKIQVNTNGELI